LTKETKYLSFLTLLYFIVSFIGIQHHELWLDESHHYLLARDSVSFFDLIRNTRYEGHPIMWNFLLFIITRFTLDPFWMQLLHILISTTVVFIFLRKAPFSLLVKTLFIFGYFMLFEYNLISRNYMLGVLFLFLACSVYKDRGKRFNLLCLYLALAANTHLIFTIVSFALFLTLLFERYANKELLNKRSIRLGFWIFTIGILIAVLQIIPPDDTLFFNRVHQIPIHEKFSKGFISLFKGLLTIPDFRTLHFWNSNLFVTLSKPVSGMIGFSFYLLPILLFYKNKKVLFFTYAALLGSQAFFFVTQMSATRYDGMAYIIIIIAFWIEQYHNEAPKRFPVFKKAFLMCLLLLQLFSGIYSYAMDFKHPFCVAKETVTYLKSKKIKPEDVITITCDGTLLSPFLGQKVYFLCEERLNSYCHWDKGCSPNITEEMIIAMISTYMLSHNHSVYVSTQPITNDMKPNVWITINDTIRLRFLKKFEQSIVRNADYYIFEVSKIPNQN
jgi:hypothetical protein